MRTQLMSRLRLVLAALVLLPMLVHAQQGADLNISPKRLVFSGANRAATVYVFNRGTTGASYSIDLVDRVMLPDGQILALSDVTPDSPGSAAASHVVSARPMISFSPRRVTLGPGESQVIRVRVLQPAGLAAGEYRTHLTVSTLPPEDTGLTAEQVSSVQEGQLAVQVVALLSLSIPVIVRQDVNEGAASIQSAALVSRSGSDGPPATVDFALGRSGAGSVYGDLEVVAQSGKGKPEVIGAVKGLAVYPEVDSRAVSIPLQRAPHAGEQVSVRYTDDDASPGEVLATAAVNVR